MKQHIANQQFDYEDFLLFVPHVLRLTPGEIYRDFQRFSSCKLRYYESREEEYYLELRFATLGITVTCYFNAQNTCYQAYVFTDTIHDTVRYIRYLSQHFPYHQPHNYWQLPHCKLQVIQTEDDVMLRIYE